MLRSTPIESPFALVFLASSCVVFLMVENGACGKDEHMVLTGLEGEVTTNEYRSFLNKLNYLPPPPSNNLGNLMVYERVGGGNLHGMQTFYLFTKDRGVLDKVMVWSDAFLHGRNDPADGRIVWTGKRELCWPNKATNDEAQVLYSGAENGDVIEHIVNTAKLILENPSLWPQEAPTDTFGFGKTYLDRAKTYVNECQRSAETTIVPWYVRNTKDGYRLIHPDSKIYYKYCESSGPVPWNQQQCIVGALLCLAQCHRLLNDGNTNIAYYEKITGDAANWFFSNAKLVNVNGTNCYDWGYVFVNDPEEHREDTGHSFYDVYILRAYQANLGPSRVEMQRLINTALFVINRGSNRFGGYVNGVTNQYRAERKYLNYGWIEMSVLDRRLYKLTSEAVLASHEYYDNIPVEAAVLYAKHYWATAPPGAETEVVDPAKEIPAPKVQSRSTSRRYLPPVSFFGILVGLSEIFLARRSKSNAISRRSLAPIWLVSVTGVAVAILVAGRLHSWWNLWQSKALLAFCCGLVLFGLALRWYSIIYRAHFFTTNAAITSDHRLVDSGPYRFVRHPGSAGILMAILGLALSFGNWASGLVLFVPVSAVILWRIQVEEQILISGLGDAYRNYTKQTRRLIPLLY